MTERAFDGLLRQPTRIRRFRSHATQHAVVLAILPIIAGTISLALTKTEYRYLAAPVLTMVSLAAIYTAVLWNRDRRLPVFEVGSLWVASTVVYSALPFVTFMAMGLRWSPLGDSRLLAYEFNVQEIGAFAWRHVVYLASFICVYLALRGRRAARSAPLNAIPSQLITALAVILVFQYAFKWAMSYGYGLDLDISYSDMSVLVSRVASTPILLLQITLIILASILLVKQALLLVLIQQWRSLKWRIALVAWLAIETVTVVVRMGGRGQAVRLILAFAVLYDRFARPLRAKWIMGGGALLLTGFIVQGDLRSALSQRELSAASVLTSANEFEALFATAYDIYKRKEVGNLGVVPWQVYVSDLYILIPRQLLPFEKIDPSEWYLGVIGARGTGVGFMFGVMSQAVLGLDWIELGFRGAILGLLLAGFHRWYVRYCRSFWVTLFYLFIAIWIYYTFRATSFWLIHFIVYQFIPVVLSARIIEYSLSRWPKRIALEAGA